MKWFALAIFTAFSAVILLFCAGCDAKEPGPLKDVSRPYTGIYDCERLSLGDKDMTDKFEKFSLELMRDGAFKASFETKEGNVGSYDGVYTVDTERGEITLSSKQGMRTKSFTFPYEKGRILIDYNLFGALLHAEFKMP